jgi:hypothetical protein
MLSKIEARLAEGNRSRARDIAKGVFYGTIAIALITLLLGLLTSIFTA